MVGIPSEKRLAGVAQYYRYLSVSRECRLFLEAESVLLKHGPESEEAYRNELNRRYLRIGQVGLVHAQETLLESVRTRRARMYRPRGIEETERLAAAMLTMQYALKESSNPRDRLNAIELWAGRHYMGLVHGIEHTRIEKVEDIVLRHTAMNEMQGLTESMHASNYSSPASH